MNALTEFTVSPVLDVHALQLGIGGKGAQRKLVRDVSFTLRRGRTLALVGESGSGKTLTALSILRLLPDPPVRILDGHIRFGDTDLAHVTAAGLRQIRGSGVAMIFQEPQSALNPVMSIGRQLREAVLAHEKLDRKALDARVRELLELVRLPDPDRIVHEFPHRLSGGMRQRVLIAIAMAGRPRVLIADEPTTALDVTVQREILDMLAGLQERFGVAILLITHDLGLVSDYADEVAVMYAGRIVERGPARGVLADPLHPYTRGLLGARPGLVRHSGGKPPRLAEISGSVPANLDSIAGCPFSPRCPLAGEQCRLRAPELLVAADGHFVSCFKQGLNA
jgi:oligopeptide/dipeptide ABC transporter ATP-binding protein